MRAAAVPPLCCVAQPDAEDALFRQRWCRRLPCSAIGRVLPEARALIQCNVASSPGSTGSESGKIHHLGECVSKIPAITTPCSIREARIEDFWQVADTHCSSFMPEQGLLMDFALRFDRVMALVGSLPLHKKKCLVAVEEEPYVEEFIVASLFSNLITSHLPNLQVSGILTIDNIGEYLPRRRPSGRRRTGIAYVSNVAVRQTKRRKGIAKKLLKASEQLAKSWGCRSIALHCDANNPGAVSLYTGQGYKVVKIPMAANWPQPKGLQGSNFVLMMKSLASL